MTERNFLNIHVLISHSPSCLNRDDMNMQKTAVFGGVRRVRISSQSLKRAMRKSPAYEERLGRPSIRTRDLAKLEDALIEALADRFDAELVSRAITLIAGKESAKESATADAVAPWCAQEVARVCELMAEQGGKTADPRKLQQAMEKEAVSVRQAIGQATDIALFGRMTTEALRMLPVDGACSVAHAITTHATEADVDWFTAVDDLTTEAGESGAGHLNTQEFGSGVFYRYASLNIAQLQKNMGTVTRDDALDVAAHLTHLLATVVPEAKQNTFAAHNLADFVLVSFADLPVSAANAFERPVERAIQGGFTGASIGKLEEYVEKIHTGYGLNEERAAFSIWDTTLTPRHDRLAELEEWIRKGGE